MPRKKKATPPNKSKKVSPTRSKVVGSVLLDFTVDCLRCMRPVPISAVEPLAQCRACLHLFDVEQLFRGSAAGCVSNAFEGKGDRTTHFDGDCTFSSRTRMAKPTCGGCGVEIDPASLVEREEDHVCSCGATLAVRPSDALVRAINKYAVAIAGERPRTPLEPTEPVAFACSRCKASLSTDGTARSVDCVTCAGFVDVPERLWSTLHPVRPRPPIFLLLRGSR